MRCVNCYKIQQSKRTNRKALFPPQFGLQFPVFNNAYANVNPLYLRICGHHSRHRCFTFMLLLPGTRAQSCCVIKNFYLSFCWKSNYKCDVEMWLFFSASPRSVGPLKLNLNLNGSLNCLWRSRILSILGILLFIPDKMGLLIVCSCNFHFDSLWKLFRGGDFGKFALVASI